jgi:chemotaxis protein MotB
MSSRRNRGGGGHGDGGEERWLLPYADMITLLLGLFIVLFAMSTLDSRKFDNLRSSLSQTFSGQVMSEPGNVLPGSNGVLDPASPSDEATESISVSQQQSAQAESREKFDQETQQLQKMAQQSGLGNSVKVTRSEMGIEIEIAGDALFPSGSWQLIQPGILDKLKRIEAEMAAFNHPIRIVGHTDGAPYPGEFGNWGLSSNRANAVGAYFRSLGFPDARIVTEAKADTDPAVKPSSPTDSVAANRRIEIIILEPGADDGFANAAADAAPSRVPAPARRPTASDVAAAQVSAQLGREFDSSIVAELAATGKAAQ